MSRNRRGSPENRGRTAVRGGGEEEEDKLSSSLYISHQPNMRWLQSRAAGS